MRSITDARGVFVGGDGADGGGDAEACASRAPPPPLPARLAALSWRSVIGRFICSRAGTASSLSPPPPPADGAGCSLQARKEGYADLVNTYYNLATDFYEIGWGQSFHFANKFAGETFNESITRCAHHPLAAG